MLKRTRTTNNRGFASIEAVVLLVLLVSLVYYTFGFFGVVHTGILHNIHARTYAYETFRHRANLMYFRSNRVKDSGVGALHFYNKDSRLHGINTDSVDNPVNQVATERPISMGLILDANGRNDSTHNNDVLNKVNAGRNSTVSVNPVWITTLYGICLQSSCGG